MPSKVDILIAQVRALQSTLQKATPEQKEGHASTAIVDNFNRILENAGDSYPDLKESLPEKITSEGPFADMGSSDVTYLDLGIFAEQVLAMLDLVDDEQ